MAKEQKILKEMTIRETLQKYPKAVFVLLDYGFHCIGCEMAHDETLEQAAVVHRVDLEKLLKDLNKATGK